MTSTTWREPPRRIPRLALTETWQARDLITLFTIRDFKLRYVQTVMGPIWVLLQPLAPSLLFLFVFTEVAPVDTQGVPYLVLITAAIAPWNAINRAVQKGGTSLIYERSLLTKVYFPRLVLPVSAVMSSLIELGVSLAIALVVALAKGIDPTFRWFALIPFALLTMVVALAAVVIIAAATVRRRDIVHLSAFVMQIWFFCSPIVYPSLPAKYRSVASWNPMVLLADGFRYCIAGTAAPSATEVAKGLIGTTAALLLGLYGFKLAERDIADVL